MRGLPIILTLRILVLSDVVAKFTKSRNHTGILFIAYTTENGLQA